MTYKAQKPKDPDGLFRALVIGRVSTTKQQESNIEASYDYVRPILKQIYEGPVEIKELGEQGSGLLTERATILEAIADLETGRWDLVLMEDISRAYRNPRWQFAFVQDAVDLETRVICPGDQLDTFEENWEVTMGAAALRHGLHIPDTRRRVRRTADHSFRHGGMVQKIRFGYPSGGGQGVLSGRQGAPQGHSGGRDPARAGPRYRPGSASRQGETLPDDHHEGIRTHRRGDREGDGGSGRS
jgi:hypothetical protein